LLRSAKALLANGAPVETGDKYELERFATLDDVIEHYDGHLGLHLTDQERRDLAEYLKSIRSHQRTQLARFEPSGP
jgi:hypothetical protein